MLVGFFIVQIQAQSSSETEITFGSEYILNTASTSDIFLIPLSETKFAAAYRDGAANLNQGRAAIADVSDKTISFGEKYTFNSESTKFISSISLLATKFVIAFKDGGNLDYGTLVVADVADKTIDFGAEYIFNNGLTEDISLAVLSPTKFIVAYQDKRASNNQGKVKVGEVAGKTVTFGQEYVFNSTGAVQIAANNLSADKFIIAYQDKGQASYGTAVIANISDKTITFGTKYVFNPSLTDYISLKPLSQSKFFVAYQDGANNLYDGRLIIGEISETEITFGQEYVFNPSATYFISAGSLTENKIAVSYQDAGQANYGQTLIGKISDKTISFGQEYTFNPTKTNYVFSAGLDKNTFAAAYQDASENLNYGRIIIGQLPEEAVSLPAPQETTEEVSETATTTESVAETPTTEETTPSTTEITIADGDLIRNPNASGLAQFDVYIVKLVGTKKFKRLILSPHVFNSYGHLSWSNIKDVSQSKIDEYTVSDLVRAQNDTKVYKLTPAGDTGQKQWLNMTAVQFISQNYDADSIYTINNTDRDAYETGAELIFY